jgi:hypothetical protein
MKEKENSEALYYSRIEELFIGLRESPLLLTGKDFALMKSWYRAGIPLRVVLRGIGDAFEKFEQKKPGPGRKVNSLRYCEQAVLSAWRSAREGLVGKHSRVEKPPDGDDGLAAGISGRLEALLTACRDAYAGLEADKSRLQQLNRIIDCLEGLLQDTRAGISLEIEDMEKQLMSLETDMIARLRETAPEETIQKLDTEYREKILKRSRAVARKELDALTEKLVNERLLSDAGIPRLSLFTL